METELPGKSDHAPTQRALETLATRIGELRGAHVVVAGSRGGGAALVSLLAALKQLGLIDDQTVA